MNSQEFAKQVMEAAIGEYSHQYIANLAEDFIEDSSKQKCELEEILKWIEDLPVPTKGATYNAIKLFRYLERM
ncbi:MAG: hypothetical protein EOO06_00890 [Chitinophagaceae bacterium]|nr:MAG: hypothetical protein EOO06_00890 [Chitinophagaceae bacterium]